MYLILLIFLFSGNAAASMFPGQELIDSFGSACTSNTGMAEMALNDSRALMQSLENLKNDPDCQNAYSAISQLGGLENRLLSLNAEYSDKIEIARLEGQEMELMAQIASTNDQDTIGEIEVALRAIQLDKAGFIATDNAINRYDSEKLKSLYSQIIYSTDSTYNVIASNQRCLDKNPGLLTAATALSGSLASSAMLVNPALGLGMGALSEFVNQTVVHFRNKGFNRRIRNIANPTTVFHGFKCAMETLSNRYCGINDALDFLKLEDHLKNDGTVQSEMYEVSEVYDRDLPILMDWLEKVKAGAPAANTADAERIGKIFDKEANLKKARVFAQGIFQQQEPIYYNPSNSPAVKFNILKDIVIQITEKAYGSIHDTTQPTPLADVYSVGEAPFRLLGFPGQPSNASDNLIYISSFQLKDWTPQPNFDLKYQEVISEFDKLIEKAQERYNQEFTLFLQPDPTMTIASYTERTNNVWKRAPQTALLNILDFIKDNVPESIEDSGFGDIYESTILELEKIDLALSGKLPSSYCDRIVEFPLPLPPERNPRVTSYCQNERKVIEVVFNTAKLEFGTIVFQNRVESIIRIAIDKYIQNSQSENRNHIAQLLAANSFLDVLKKVQGTDNKTLIKNNLQEAKSIAYTNLKQFGDTFGGHINAVLNTMSDDVNHRDSDISGPAIKSRAKFCFLLAALPEWPRGVWKGHCNGLKIEAMYKDGPDTREISETLLRERLKKRACLYRNYFRDSEIYRQWNIKI